jgi:hypothetical protein
MVPMVETANDGVNAVAEVERFHPEVILMDVGMPRLNGLDAKGVPGTASAVRTRLLAGVVDLVARLGWRSWKRTRPGQIWEERARGSPDQQDQLHFLRRALEAAEEAKEVNRIRGQVEALTNRQQCQGGEGEGHGPSSAAAAP